MSQATLPAPARTAARGAANRPYGVLVEFDSPIDLKVAAEAARDEGFTRWDTHSPFPIHGMERAMGIRMTILPVLVFACGATGMLTGLFLQWWANASDPIAYQFVFEYIPTWFQAFLGYGFLVSGKPYFSLPANIPIIFELTVLFSAIGAVFLMFGINGLPCWNRPIFQCERFRRVTDDRFFLCVEAADPKFDPQRTLRWAESLGGAAVEVLYDRDESDDQPPAIFARVGLFSALLALIPLLIIVMARSSKSESPRWHIIQDMDNQERYKAQQAMPLFADGRSMRPVVAGTVARGAEFLQEDEHFFRGLVDAQLATSFPPRDPTRDEPLIVDDAFLRRGQERFNIVCAQCHGRDGIGQGLVNQRGLELTGDRGGAWVQATNMHDAEPRGRAHGHLFNTITNGIRTMPAYGDRIPERDRWAIVAYVRALQRARNARESDFPPDVLRELEARRP